MAIQPPADFDQTVRLESLQPDDRRTHVRFLFQARVIIVLEGGQRLWGETRNVSYQGAFIQTAVPPKGVRVGCGGLLKIALMDDGDVESFCVEYPCAVVRTQPDGVGLSLVVTPENPLGAGQLTPGASVYMQRSDGSIEPGWEILESSVPLPVSIRLELTKQQKEGPLVVCYKEGPDHTEGLFKVLSVHQLKKIQEKAASKSKKRL